MLETMFEQRNHLILVVDDSRLMRVAFRDVLEKEGYDVAEAENGAEALVKFAEIKPDIVLMDYVMPEMDGVAACAVLQQLPDAARVPIIMITSMDDEKSVSAAFDAGATDYIAKPVNWAVLRQRLRRLLKARDTEKTLDRSEAFARSIIEHADVGIITAAADGMIKYVNPAAERIFGYAADELARQSIKMIIPALPFESSGNAPPDKTGKANIDCELSGRHKQGAILPLECTISGFWADDKYFYTVIVRDITERKRYEEIIKYQAFYDALTDLPNRVLLKDRMMHEIARVARNKKKLAVLYLDLDGFKLVNDALGHDSGDKVLKEVAKRLKNSLRATDTVARMGGDEFVILLPDLIARESIAKVSVQLLNVIKQPIDININAQVNFITGSIGVAICPDDGTDYETLLSNADAAMYQAKEKGRNNFQFYTPTLRARNFDRAGLENNLRRA